LKNTSERKSEKARGPGYVFDSFAILCVVVVSSERDPPFRVIQKSEDAFIVTSIKIMVVPLSVEHARVDAGERQLVASTTNVDTFGEVSILASTTLATLLRSNLVKSLINCGDLCKRHVMSCGTITNLKLTDVSHQAGLIVSQTTSSPQCQCNFALVNELLALILCFQVTHL